MNDDIYKNEGMAIFIKGKMVIGIHPDNLENTIKSLSDGEMKFDWEMLLERVKG